MPLPQPSLPRLTPLVRWGCPKLAGLALVLPLALGPLPGGAATATAQVRFTWPDTAVDYSLYKSVDECLAATDRVREMEVKRARIKTGVWYDTVSYDFARLNARRSDGITFIITNEPGGNGQRMELPDQDLTFFYQSLFPPAATDAAVRCSARLGQPSAADKYDFLYFTELYLQANRDAEAVALVKRRLEAVPSDRQGILDALTDSIKYNHPVWIAAMESLYVAGLKGASLPQRINAHLRLARLAATGQDTARARGHMAQVVAEWPLLDAGIRQRRLVGNAMSPRGSLQKIYDPFAVYYRSALLDTLRQHGTARYVAARAALWARLSGTTQAAFDHFKKLHEFHKLVGQPAPAVVGDYWFRRGDSATARPTRGKVGLIVFAAPSPPGALFKSPGVTDSSANYNLCLPVRDTQEGLEVSAEGQDDRNERNNCWVVPAVLRRLAARFPALEITVVTQTHGNMVYAAYPKEPEKEVELIRQWLHDVQRMPGALAVATSKHQYFPEPDGRVAERLMVPNTANYFASLGETWSEKFNTSGGPIFTGVVPNGAAFLVDPEGTVVTALRINGRAEYELTELIDILQRQSARR